MLHISNGSETKRIVFKNGEIVFAGTNVQGERLGECLVRAGKIKRSVLDLACRVIERSHERFGTTIVEMGWVSPYEMQWSVAEQIKIIIYSVFTWDSGEYRFEPSNEPVDQDLTLELQTAEVIWEGARLVSDLKAVRAGLGAYSGVLQFARGKRLAIPISQKEGFILSRVEGRSTISDIVSSSPLGEEDTLRRIYALLLAGVIELTESPPSVPSKPESDAPPASAKSRTGPFRGGTGGKDRRVY